ncbi:winged helix DNA-binding domain-containing protein [Conexibacter sp. SYSU D00693]|uniref:winged helix DNA-binding domain-containing protein n=1 Tax=Conexibacter sp. SYSU D00693 TaxID=2812560 RepID=UPI00196B610B|nr:winged helix DNA-binding domain-containing protein [Conexibacter sp. SYSU D00693]
MPRTAATSRPVTTVTHEQVRGLRARRHHLDARVPHAAALDVVRDLCGLHAQVLSSAVLQLWARVDDLASGEVEALLWEDRLLVKTWAMRGTLHLLRADDLALYAAAHRAIPQRQASPAWLKANGLTADQAAALFAAVPAVLEGEPLTREALAAALGEAVGHDAAIEAALGSWGSVLKPAAMVGELCFADGDERRVRFTTPERWLGAKVEERDPQEALLEVTRRFLRAFGPATREDLARWLGISSAATAGRWLAALEDEVVPVAVQGDPDGLVRTALAGDVDALAAAAPPPEARLLPAFDHHTVALLRDPAILDQSRRAEISRAAGWITPVVLVGGAIAGVWRHERRGRAVEVTIEPWGRLPRGAKAQLRVEAERLATFLGGDLRLLER